MPWSCCGTTLNDDLFVCPACGQPKVKWTTRFKKTRRLVITRKAKLTATAEAIEEAFVASGVLLDAPPVLGARADEEGDVGATIAPEAPEGAPAVALEPSTEAEPTASPASALEELPTFAAETDCEPSPTAWTAAQVEDGPDSAAA